MFNPPTSVIIERKGEELKLPLSDKVSIYADNEEDELFHIYHIQSEGWGIINNLNLPGIHAIAPTHSKIEMARLVCRLFRFISRHPRHISLQITLFIDGKLEEGDTFKQLSHPYMRPRYEWNTIYDGNWMIETIFKIDMPDTRIIHEEDEEEDE